MFPATHYVPVWSIQSRYFLFFYPNKAVLSQIFGSLPGSGQCPRPQESCRPSRIAELLIVQPYRSSRSRYGGYDHRHFDRQNESFACEFDCDMKETMSWERGMVNGENGSHTTLFPAAGLSLAQTQSPWSSQGIGRLSRKCWKWCAELFQPCGHSQNKRGTGKRAVIHHG